ncbi:MAG TPA: putative quinol monooxygenase [Anaerolineales bacterium]|nr:putative quinol monooxygenase [Anaerolineales bacterium]
MYGLIGKIKANRGKRNELISILLESADKMPGCMSYVVAKDASDEDAIWVTEVWTDQESHQNSLSLPVVQEAISRGRPLMAGFGERFESIPIGGHGLVSGR